jgi:small neutral amino acid transporter SnatA (MarC family)
MEGSFVSAVVLLLLVCDPLGNVPIVVSALREVPPERRRRVILRECLIAFVVLVVFAFFGRSFLQLLGLSEFSLQIGGAVVLMLVALRMVFPTPEGIYGRPPGGEPFIVPLAVPAIAGPSALAATLMLVSRDPGRMAHWIGAIAVVMAVSAGVLAFAEDLQRRLGDRVTVAIERLVGLILAAMAVELALRGIRSFSASL